VFGAIRNGADAAVPLLSVSDVVKREDADGRLITIARDGCGLAQVPMGFSTVSLVAAHIERDRDEARIWEDSMLVERAGGTVVAVQGSSLNVHVVTQGDLELARAIAKARAEGASHCEGDPGIRV
jgi:2-C-methyl-D-erythritol 4-phosphate cytidylyltransferase